MKAIVNVSNFSSYSDLNGRTFEVRHICESGYSIGAKTINLIVEEKEITFTHKEVIIVDIDSELQREYDSKNWGNSWNKFGELQTYAITNKISFIKPTYNCPA